MKKNLITERIIDEGLIQANSYIVVGVSGGPDSLCLLHALDSIASGLHLTIIPVHIDHMLRPESAQEADKVANYCDKLDLECQLFKADIAENARLNKISIEVAGREIRYQIFDDAAREIEEQGVEPERIFIATAHNSDDQAETVLYRLIRGTGTHGIGGMQSIRPSDAGYTIIKPLLSTTREEIENYIKEHRLHPNIDASNFDNDYTRNKIRNKLIPYLEKEFNPSIKSALCRFAEIANNDDAALMEISFMALDENINISEDNTVMINITELKTSPPPILSRIVRIALEVVGLESHSTYELLTNIMALIYHDNPSASLDLPSNHVVYRDYDTLIFSDADKTKTRKIPAPENLRLFPQVMMRKEWKPDDDSIHAAFDFDKFNEDYPGKVGSLTLRTRRRGDYIPMKEGNKKIQDYFVDSKVSKNARDSIMMVAIDHEILWILPSKYLTSRTDQDKGKFSQKYQITDATERVLYIEIAEEI